LAVFGLPTLKDDWKAAARKTPALIEGQYFDQPTEIDDQGVSGIYGVFDVSNGPKSSHTTLVHWLVRVIV
jgi:hypothetical protein